MRSPVMVQKSLLMTITKDNYFFVSIQSFILKKMTPIKNLRYVLHQVFLILENCHLQNHLSHLGKRILVINFALLMKMKN